MLKKLSLKDVGIALDGVCNRTATKRCKEYGVKIYPTEKGPRRWVYAAELYKALHAPLFPDLIKKYGERALEAFQAYIDNDPLKLMMLEQEKQVAVKNVQKYKPEGELEKKFLDIILSKSKNK